MSLQKGGKIQLMLAQYKCLNVKTRQSRKHISSYNCRSHLGLDIWWLNLHAHDMWFRLHPFEMNFNIFYSQAWCLLDIIKVLIYIVRTYRVWFWYTFNNYSVTSYFYEMKYDNNRMKVLNLEYNACICLQQQNLASIVYSNLSAQLQLSFCR